MRIRLKKRKFWRCLRGALLPALFLIGGGGAGVSAQDIIGNVKGDVIGHDTLNVAVFFRQGKADLDLSFRNNLKSLQALHRKIFERHQGERVVISKMQIYTGASPEGNTALNSRLSEERAKNIKDFLIDSYGINPAKIETFSKGTDWEGLTAMVEASNMPYKKEVLNILHNTPEWISRGGKVVDGRKKQLMELESGKPWRYMSEHFFPDLRSAGQKLSSKAGQRVVGVFERIKDTVRVKDTVVARDTVVAKEVVTVTDTIRIRDTIRIIDTIRVPASSVGVVATRANKVRKAGRPFKMALRTNMLYDIAAQLSGGVEVYVWRNFTIAGNWMWGWKTHYTKDLSLAGRMGDLEFRYYFGRKAKEGVFRGHHVGLYGQLFTCDFENGDTGYLVNNPGPWGVGGGVAYGYAMPIGGSGRLNLDFTIGVGYLQADYQQYQHIDNCHVWQKSATLEWVGPTKAEVTLAWKLFKDTKAEKVTKALRTEAGSKESKAVTKAPKASKAKSSKAKTSKTKATKAGKVTATKANQTVVKADGVKEPTKVVTKASKAPKVKADKSAKTKATKAPKAKSSKKTKTSKTKANQTVVKANEVKEATKAPKAKKSKKGGAR